MAVVSANTYKFKSLSEQLRDVNIPASVRLASLIKLDERETYLASALADNSGRVQAKDFVAFERAIYHKCSSLALLLHHKTDVIQSWSEIVAIAEEFSVSALLECLVGIAYDLRVEFAPYLFDIFTVLQNLITKHDKSVEILDACFKTISILFLVCSKRLLIDIKRLLACFEPLLKSCSYIVQFLAEAFAFLMRKCKNISEMMEYALVYLPQQPLTTTLLHDMLVMPCHVFHSQFASWFPSLLRLLNDDSVETITIVVKSLTSHCYVKDERRFHEDSISLLHDCLLKELTSSSASQLLNMLRLLNASHSVLKRVPKEDALCSFIEQNEILRHFSSVQDFELLWQTMRFVSASRIYSFTGNFFRSSYEDKNVFLSSCRCVVEESFYSSSVDAVLQSNLDQLDAVLWADITSSHYEHSPPSSRAVAPLIINKVVSKLLHNCTCETYRRINIILRAYKPIRDQQVPQLIEKYFLKFWSLATNDEEVDTDANSIFNSLLSAAESIKVYKLSFTVGCIDNQVKRLHENEVFLNLVAEMVELGIVSFSIDVEDFVVENGLLIEKSESNRRNWLRILYTTCGDKADVIQMLLEAENVALDMKSYRQRLMLFSQIQSAFAKSKLPMHYLISQFNVDFSLLWKPASDALAVMEEESEGEWFHSEWARLMNKLMLLDFPNLRLLLWRTLARFNERGIRKHSHAYFLKFKAFIETELQVIFATKAIVDVRTASSVSLTIKINFSSLRKLLIEMLETLKKCHLSQLDVLIDLLSIHDSEIQRLVLQVLLKNAKKYRRFSEDLMALTDAKELSLSLLSKRDDLPIELVSNLLYGQLGLKLKRKKARNSQRGGRNKMFILQSLATATPDELTGFVTILLRSVADLTSADMVFNAAEALQPSRLLRFVGIVEAFLGICKTIDQANLSKMINKCLLANSYASLGRKTDEVSPQYRKAFATISKMTCRVIFSLFDSFDYYVFDEPQLAMVVAIAWRMCEFSDSKLLTLASFWSASPKYAQLLLLKHPDSNNSILRYIINHLLPGRSPSASQALKVITICCDITRAFFTPNDDDVMDLDDENCCDEIHCELGALRDSLMKPDEKETVFQQVVENVCSFIVLMANKRTLSSNKQLVATSLELLDLLLPNLSDSDLLSSALLNFMLHSKQMRASSDLQASVMSTLLKLADKVHKIKPLLKILSSSIRSTEDSLLRRHLLEYTERVTKGGKYERFFEQLRQVEANQATHLNAIDYTTRASAFKSLRSAIIGGGDDEMTLDLLSIRFLSHQMMHLISNTDEFFLRDSARDILEQLICKVSEKKHKELLIKLILAFVSSSMKQSVDQSVHFASLNLLRTCVMTLGEQIKCLSAFLPFICESDEQKDVFKGLTSLNLATRAKAMRRITTLFEATPSSSTLYSFLLRLSERYMNVKDQSVSDSSSFLAVWLSSSMSDTDYFKLLNRYTTLLQKDGISRQVISSYIKMLGTPRSGGEKDKKLFKDLSDRVNSVLSFIPVDEESELLGRVPLCQVLSRLLTAANALDQYLPNVMTKLVNFLKSRFHDVRKMARKYLLAIAEDLGVRYVEYFVVELCEGLRYGYQKHVLAYTLAELLQLKWSQGCLNKNMINRIAGVYCWELFGVGAEEKSIGAIITKTIEAKRNSATIGLTAAAKICPPVLLPDLFSPLMKQVYLKHDASITAKCINVLKSCVPAVISNPDVNEGQIVALVSEFLKEEKQRHYILDLFLFQLLNAAVKAWPSLKLQLGLFHNFLLAGVGHSHPIVCESALRLCSALPGNCVSAELFNRLIKNLNREIMKSNTESPMLGVTYKCLAKLIEQGELDVSSSEAAAGYAESMLACIHESLRSNSAVNLLHVLLKRRIQSNDLQLVMMAVAARSSQSVDEANVKQGHSCVIEYLLSYPKLATKSRDLIEHFLIDLENANNIDFLRKYMLAIPPRPSVVFELIFMQLVAALDLPQNRKNICDIIVACLDRLSNDDRSTYIQCLIDWFDCTKTGVRIASLRILLNILTKTRLTWINPACKETFYDGLLNSLTLTESHEDEMLYICISILTKIIDRNIIDRIDLDRILKVMSPVNLHPNAWIREAAANLWAAVFAKAGGGIKVETSLEPIIHDLTEQLNTEHASKDLIEQVSRNCFALSKLLPIDRIEKMMYRMNGFAMFEQKRAPKSISKRKCVLLLSAAITQSFGGRDLSIDEIDNLLPTLMLIPLKNCSSSDDAFAALCNETIALQKETFGLDRCNRVAATLHDRWREKRSTLAADAAALVVTDYTASNETKVLKHDRKRSKGKQKAERRRENITNGVTAKKSRDDSSLRTLI